jgi:serine/threonine protein kinase
MKSIKKIYLEEKNEVNDIILKKWKIQNLKNIFLMGCVASFQTDERIYFILNLIEGESFSDYLSTRKTTEEKQIKFFMAIIGLTLDYFHKNGISFRNLHPNDIIIEKDGYLKISDIKLNSLFKIKQNNLILKNAEWSSPEELEGKKVDKEADWWIYGIILYELFYGIPPFFSEDEKKLKELIEKSELRFPKEPKINKSAIDLMILLLNKNPEKRLGHNKDFDDIKNHEFFSGFNFNDISNKKIKSNYLPQIGNVITDKEKKIIIPYEDAVNSKIINL